MLLENSDCLLNCMLFLDLSRLIHFSTLELSGNLFQSFQSLGKLNLFRNKLSGDISNCFDDMTALLHVDISYNAFSGLIPNSRVFANASKNYEGIVVCVEMLKDCNLEANVIKDIQANDVNYDLVKTLLGRLKQLKRK
ncbi:hypothetical protein LguiB_013591 [Lonicera macranthoides]